MRDFSQHNSGPLFDSIGLIHVWTKGKKSFRNSRGQDICEEMFTGLTSLCNVKVSAYRMQGSVVKGISLTFPNFLFPVLRFAHPALLNVDICSLLRRVLLQLAHNVCVTVLSEGQDGNLPFLIVSHLLPVSILTGQFGH